MKAIAQGAFGAVLFVCAASAAPPSPPPTGWQQSHAAVYRL
jgi:hypothetical protein